MKTIAILLASAALLAPARAFDGLSIADAVKQLDPANNDHWTADGLPRIDTIRSLTGDQTVTREMVNSALPGFNRGAAGAAPPAPPAPPASSNGSIDPMAAAEADGWIVHPDAAGYHYKGTEVVADADLATRYATQDTSQGAQSAPSGGDQTAEQSSDQAQDISGQTGMGSGATTARSPAPVEGELRETHVSLPSNGQPGELPVGIVQGVTGTGGNQVGTPDGPVQNAARDIELSGEVAARSAGSVLTPAQAPADASNSPSISLGGAADPAVEAAAPGGAVVAEGADAAKFLEGPAAGGPFGSSGITSGEAELTAMDDSRAGDPELVAAKEKELETVEAEVNDLRCQMDELDGKLHAGLRRAAFIRREIAAATPRTGNMETIQSFLGSMHARRIAAAEADAKK